MMRISRVSNSIACVLAATALVAGTTPAAAFADADAAETDAAKGEEVTAGSEASASPAAIDGELIVTYKTGTSARKIARAAEVDADSTEKLARDADGSDISLVTLDEGQDDADAIEQLKTDPRVESVEHNVTFHALTTTVNDSYVVNYPDYSYYLSTEGIEDAWDSSKTEGTVTVAVLDSGVSTNSSYRDPELENTVDFDDAYNAVDDGWGVGTLSSSFIDTCCHGTAVSELIAAQANNGEGIAGVSYDATVLPVRVIDESGEGDLADLVRGYSHVLSVAESLNVKVINMSIGGATTEDMSSLQTLVDTAYDRGILTVAAAGNEGSAADGNPVEYPAALDHVVSVGAVDSTGTVTSWSEHNAYVDLTAAGDSLCVPWFWNESLDNHGGRSPWSPGRATATLRYTADNYVVESGTSFSAPIVSGVAALLYASDSSATAEEVEYALESSATDRGTTGRDDYYGHGELDAPAALAALPTASADIKANAAEVAAFKKLKTKVSTKKRAKKSLKVSWTKLSGAKGYRVYYRAKGKKSWKKLTTAKRTKKIAGLKRKTKYQIRVRGYMKAWDGSTVWSTYSKTVTLKTK